MEKRVPSQWSLNFSPPIEIMINFFMTFSTQNVQNEFDLLAPFSVPMGITTNSMKFNSTPVNLNI